MATSLPFSSVSLNESDIPGASFTEENIEDHTVVQLRRWLQCRGMSMKGKKTELVERCKSVVASGSQHQFVTSIDGGRISTDKVTTLRREILKDVQNKPPIFPTFGWKPFPSKDIPSSFSYDSIYHHLVQSAILISANHDNGSHSTTVTDVHTAKPLQKGRVYFKSRNVLDMEDHCLNNQYCVKAKVMASYQADTKYPVLLMLDKVSGMVIDASCECKASSIGRCNHVAALLFALEDYTVMYGFKPPSCTSVICGWNRGRKEKKPAVISVKQYTSKIDQQKRMKYDPRQVICRIKSDEEKIERINSFRQNLQALSHTNNIPSMWDQLLIFKYENYELSSQRKEILLAMVQLYVQQMSSISEVPMSIEGTEGQSSSEMWRNLRWSFITASCCKEYSIVNKSASSIYHLVENHLWKHTSLKNLPSIAYENEHIALETYAKVFNVEVSATGLWVNPQMACLTASPDGLVKDPLTRELGLVEVKCPIILKEMAPTDLDILTDNQKSNFCCSLVNGNLQLKKTHKYYYQVQMQMAITDRQWCDFVIWSPQGISRERIPFVKEFWTPVGERLTNFSHGVLIPEFFEQRIPRNLQPFDLRLAP